MQRTARGNDSETSNNTPAIMMKQIATALLGATLSAGLLLPSAPAEAQGIRFTEEDLERPGYLVRPGDTLFALASRFLNDPLRWPQLWSFNPHVTNPHWIYPGDLLFVENERISGENTSREGGGIYPMAGFYTSYELDSVGLVRYADTARRLLTSHDRIYLEFDAPNEVSVGDQFAINRVLDRVYDEDDNVIAVKYLVTGSVEVIARHEETHLLTAQIVSVTDTIERGDVVFVSQPQRLRIDSVEASVDLEAEIIDTLRSRVQLHEQDYVFVNRGWEDGVEVGNRFFIWDRGDEGEYYYSLRNRDVDYEEDVIPVLPWEVVGEAMVISSTEYYSTAVIVDGANHEMRVGQRVTLQAGY